jgi:hypothetical protein
MPTTKTRDLSDVADVLLSNASYALDAAATVAALSGTKRDDQVVDAIRAIVAVVGALRSGSADALTTKKVKDALAALAKDIVAGDAAADAALKKKFAKKPR